MLDIAASPLYDLCISIWRLNMEIKELSKVELVIRSMEWELDRCQRRLADADCTDRRYFNGRVDALVTAIGMLKEAH